MNRLIVAIALFATVAFNAFSQGIGIFELTNVGTTADRHIYVGEYLGPTKASGNGYQIAIYWGPAGTSDEGAMVQVGAETGFLTGPGEGQFNAGTRTIFGLSEDGGVAALQGRAWDISSGASYEAALANPEGRTGKGPIFDMKTKDPSDLMEEVPRIGYDPGWTGFAIVPEPSTWGLALLGAAGLLLFGRRRD